MQQTVDSDKNTLVPYLLAVAESTAPSAQHFMVLVCRRCVHRPLRWYHRRKITISTWHGSWLCVVSSYARARLFQVCLFQDRRHFCLYISALVSCMLHDMPDIPEGQRNFWGKTMAIRNQWPIGMSVRYWSNEMFRLWSSWSLRCLWLTGHERINARLTEWVTGWLTDSMSTQVSECKGGWQGEGIQ